jgi:thioredoxin 1
MTAYRAASEPEPTRAEVDRMTGLVLLEFGASWCPHCQAAQPALRAALEDRDDVRHIKVEDGKGKPLGRSFRVKLWPTFVFMRGATVVDELVRPAADELTEKLARFAGEE